MLQSLQRSLRQALYGHISWKRPFNNRKMTKGRKAQRHEVGKRKGYISNDIHKNYKLLEIYMNELERLEKLPADEKVRKNAKILHFQYLVRRQEERIKEHNPEF